MYKYFETSNKPIKAWVEGIQLEEQAMEQLICTAEMPFIYRHLAVMPDVHWGMGATVGSVVATRGAIIPAAVGVDIGCGMMAVKTQLTASDLPDDLGALRSEIERRVPHGRTNNGGVGDRGAWHNVPTNVFINVKINDILAIAVKHPQCVPKDFEVMYRQAGTLGTGNHFIEICLDEEQGVWAMLHSGSRGVGNRIGTYFISKAKELAEKYMYSTWLPDKNLAYLPESSDLFKDYVDAVEWAQDYAKVNRQLMMNAVLEAISTVRQGRTTLVEEEVDCHHNYIARENHFGQNCIVTRKGAVRARKGDVGIVPGSMGAKSYIVRGLGNDDSFHSCSHGAGRKMSRGAAEQTFTLSDLESQTRGVECRKDAGVLDEIPGAYKDIDAVMAAQADLVDIKHTLKQILVVKG